MGKTFHIKKYLLVFLAIFVLTIAIETKTVNATTKKLVCVTKVTKTRAYYYNVKVKIETPYTVGKRKSIKLKKTKYYLMPDDGDADSVARRCSKKKFIKTIARWKRYGNKGFYGEMVVKNKRCIKIIDLYWP